MNKWLSISLIALLSACSSGPDQHSNTDSIATPAKDNVKVENSTPTTFLDSVGVAHKKDEFLGHKTVAFDLELNFGGKKRLNGTVYSATNSSKIKVDYADGKSLIYDGNQVYITPDTVDYPKARFDMFTWQYFFALPYKLDDQGTKWEDWTADSLNGKPYLMNTLSFDSGTGDSPDDWYVTYIDPATQQLYATAYIVTLGKSVEEANKDPHAITYEDYKEVDGIPFATKWRFWGWTKEEGLTKQLGDATVSNIRFMEDEKVFELPESKKLVPLD